MTAAEYIAKVLSYGKTDQSYLNFHATRFLLTKSLFDERHAARGRWVRRQCGRVN
jgi:hypothetical protein